MTVEIAMTEGEAMVPCAFEGGNRHEQHALWLEREGDDVWVTVVRNGTAEGELIVNANALVSALKGIGAVAG